MQTHTHRQTHTRTPIHSICRSHCGILCLSTAFALLPLTQPTLTPSTSPQLPLPLSLSLLFPFPAPSIPPFLSELCGSKVAAHLTSLPAFILPSLSLSLPLSWLPFLSLQLVVSCCAWQAALEIYIKHMCSAFPSAPCSLRYPSWLGLHVCKLPLGRIKLYAACVLAVVHQRLGLLFQPVGPAFPLFFSSSCSVLFVPLVLEVSVRTCSRCYIFR